MKLYIWIAFALMLQGAALEVDHDCTTFSGLVDLILNTDNNLYRLKDMFYPPREEPPTFITVKYNFKKNDSQDDVSFEDIDITEDTDMSDCSVTYIWAEGGFLLIQPPSIFELTSLLLNQNRWVNNNNNKPILSLSLPWQCRILVQNTTSNNSECACNGTDDEAIGLLDIATQQLRLFAKYNNAKSVVIDSSAHAYSVCEANLENIYHVIGGAGSSKAKGVIIFFTVLLFLPLISITLITTIVRSLHDGIHVRLIKPSNHKTVAGFVLMGIFVTLFITGCDAAAVYYYAHGAKGEFGQMDIHSKVSFFCTAFLLVFDILALIKVLLVLLYVCCKNVNDNTTDDEACNSCCIDKCCKVCCSHLSSCCVTCFLSQCFYMSFFAIFGTLNQENTWLHDNTDSNNSNNVSNFRTVWVIFLALVGPIVTINTHVGFVLASWLTDFEQASSVALVYLLAFTFLFFMLRQCYQASVAIKPRQYCWSVLLPLYPFRQFYKYLVASLYIMCFCNKCSTGTHEAVEWILSMKCIKCCCWICRKARYEQVELENVIGKETEHKEVQDKDFNTRAFCIVFSWGWVLLIPLGLTAFALSELPIKTVNILSNLLSTIQILILLVSLLITYKIASLSETDISRFLKKMRKVYIDLIGSGPRPVLTDTIKNFKQVDDVEAAACLVGEIAEVVVHKLPGN